MIVRLAIVALVLGAIFVINPGGVDDKVSNAWDNLWHKEATNEKLPAEQVPVLIPGQSKPVMMDAGQVPTGFTKAENGTYVPSADKPKVDLISTEGPTHPSQIATTLQKAGDNEMQGFEQPGYRLAEDAKGYPLQSEVEAIAKWANWNSDNSENRGGDFLSEAKSRNWALYQSTSVDDDSYYIIALDEDFEKTRVSFPNGNLKSGWDFPDKSDPVPTIKGAKSETSGTETSSNQESGNPAPAGSDEAGGYAGQPIG
jgi:hypothetical protein